MKRIVILLAVSFTILISCHSKSQNWSDNNGRTIIGTWEKLTILNQKDTVLYNSIDASNAKIIVDKDKNQLYIDYGQEDATYGIIDVKLVDNEFFIKMYNMADLKRQIMTLKCKIIDDDKAYWDYYGNGSYAINGKYNIFTCQSKKYRTLCEDEPMND